MCLQHMKVPKPALRVMINDALNADQRSTVHNCCKTLQTVYHVLPLQFAWQTYVNSLETLVQSADQVLVSTSLGM